MAQGQGQARTKFIKYIKFMMFVKFGWLCLAKASAEPTKFMSLINLVNVMLAGPRLKTKAMPKIDLQKTIKLDIDKLGLGLRPRPGQK